MTQLPSLADILRLEPIELNLFRGYTPMSGMNASRIFGGQVIAQALIAAYGTVEARQCHSLHAYFLRPGDPTAPVLYAVERARDGKSFATRRVTAIQHGEQIFNLSASFQQEEAGMEHQIQPPETPRAEDVSDELAAREAAAAKLPAALGDALLRERPIEMRRVEQRDWLSPEPADGMQRYWFRARDGFGEGQTIQQAVLAYASDMMLLSSALIPHGLSWLDPSVQMASLDHAIWFHRASDLREWHLYVVDSPSAQASRGFTRGEIFTAQGVLVASVCQEGLIRRRTR